ncbi:hypothetical protein BO78DRAFT_453940 [Aspergillus sclerotiicarbonarius CBS 121057]|uniref:Uncharacterized protein n=1 Tax=Aspergillus sclerotiicarbonarius (strain CBS 121057 / IBT 28362) TaxID=1448318 RepID=A0A319DXF2_ASPSB|nr:hypothetical protein BO78DRAFT_453940 [Aspergillus sclerotiicarbonarius CBS 121057]
MSLRNLFGILKIRRGRKQGHQVADDEAFEEAREEIQRALRRAHKLVKALQLAGLTDEQAARYHIICRPLTLRTDGGYSSTESVHFKPWPLLKLEQYPIDHSDKQTESDFKGHEAVFDNFNKDHQDDTIDEDDSDEDDSGDFLCNALVYEFVQYARKGHPSGNTLEHLSGWHEGDFDRKILKGRYMDSAMHTDPSSDPLASPSLTFEAVWYRTLPHELPHISLIVSYEGLSDDNLLRSEVLTLIGIMRTRLGRTELKEHTVAPVLMISCMGFLKARILQAHYTNGKLMVSKSPLHDFSTPEARQKNIPLFLLYMCSECVGDTKTIVRETKMEDTNI